jgi:hypothetical protein
VDLACLGSCAIASLGFSSIEPTSAAVSVIKSLQLLTCLAGWMAGWLTRCTDFDITDLREEYPVVITSFYR